MKILNYLINKKRPKVESVETTFVASVSAEN